MTVAANRDRGLAVEEFACDRWPVEQVGEGDDSPEWYDLEFTADLIAPTAEQVIVDAGAVVEVKSCWPRYESRAGRWWIRRHNHDRLVEADGLYALGVVDRSSEEVLRLGLLGAGIVDAIIDGEWWDPGDGGRSVEEFRQIPWTEIFDSLQLPLGGDSA